MAGRRMQVRIRLLLCLLIGLAVGSARADEVYRRAVPQPVGNWPIIVQADQIATWTSGSWKVLALNGNVYIEQGLLRLHAPRALFWVDAKSAQATNLSKTVLIAEGEIRLEDSDQKHEPKQAIIELATRGEIKVKSKAGRIEQTSLESSAFYREALPLLNGTHLKKDAPMGPKPIAATNKAEPASTIIPVAQVELQPPVVTPPLPGGAPPLDPVPSEGLAPSPTPMPRTPPALLFNPDLPESPGSLAPNTPRPPVREPIFPPGLPQPATPPARLGAPIIKDIPIPSDMISRVLQIAPRFGVPYNLKFLSLPNGEQALVVTGGVILTARFPNNRGTIDIEADRLIVWTRGNTQEFFEKMKSGSSQGNDREVELYLTGNVEIRYGEGLSRQVMRAQQVYYDVNRNKALAIDGDMEMYTPKVPNPAHVRAKEIWQLSPEEFQVYDAEFSSSQLPSDPALTLTLDRATIQERKVERFFLGRFFGDPEKDAENTERIYSGRNMFTNILGIPFFYLPYVQGNVEDPLGPLQNIAFRQDQIFGTQLLTTFDVYQLFGLKAPDGHRWNLYGDYLSERGSAVGTGYDYVSNDMFGFPYTSRGMIRGYYLHDSGIDQLGGPRDTREDAQPRGTDRGRFLWRHQQDLPEDFTYQGQYSYLSDKNFLESYNKFEFDAGPNQETFAYLKWQPGVFASTLYANVNQRDWVTETQWLPKVEAYGLGISLFDRLTYNVNASVGHAETKVPSLDEPLPAQLPTDVAINTTRANLSQTLSLPINAGPAKLVPYGVVDLTHYTKDLENESQGRFYGGGGLRASMPLSKLYSGIESELLNLNGIYHKVELSGNYFASYTDVSYNELPQLDRLNDDATDQSIRDITAMQPSLIPGPAGLALQNAPYFNPQAYAVRRLIDSRVDTLDSIQVLQGAVRQRWQTKRGYPGQEHTTDWIVFDMSASFFPNPNVDNFDKNVAFLEYHGLWNIGDRTGIRSEGWFDPFEFGTSYWNVGGFYDRTDSTRLSLTYRQFDPVRSKAVTAAADYAFSSKYAITFATTYDFGIAENLSNQLILTRRGTDLMVRMGFNYNAIVQNFGFTFEVVPLILGNTRLLQQGTGGVSR